MCKNCDQSIASLVSIGLGAMRSTLKISAFVEMMPRSLELAHAGAIQFTASLKEADGGVRPDQRDLLTAGSEHFDGASSLEISRMGDDVLRIFDALEYVLELGRQRMQALADAGDQYAQEWVADMAAESAMPSPEDLAKRRN